MKSKENFIWESLDHFWVSTPYVFRFVSVDAPMSLTPTIVNKELSFLYMISGSIKLNLATTAIVATAGDLVCINTYTPHSQEVTETAKYIRLMIDSNFLMYIGLNPSTIFINELIRDPKIDELFSSMRDEFNENSQHKIFMNSLVIYLVGYLTKNYSCKKTNKDETEHKTLLNYEHIGPVLNYINKNFKDDLSLDKLSSLCKLSKSHFLKLFKEVVGTSPLNYINKIRCNYAKQLIIEGANITTASVSSGFNTISYFSHCFKKHIGCLPSEFLVNK